MPAPETPVTPHPEPQAQQVLTLLQSLRLRWRGLGRARQLWTAVVVLFGVAWGAYEKFGAFWPTEPIIVPGTGGSSESSPANPFVVKNGSIVFPMEKVGFTCALNKAEFKIDDENGWTMAISASSPSVWQRKSQAAPIEILPNKQANFVCDTSDMVRDVEINHKTARLRGMQLQITMDYVVNFRLWVWHRHFHSDLFICDMSDGKCQWIVGPLVE